MAKGLGESLFSGKKKFLTIPLLLLAGLFLIGRSSPKPTVEKQMVETTAAPTAGPQKTEVGLSLEREEVKVTRVIDGDTIEIEGGRRIRYIGIDTSERGGCFFLEATNKNKEFVEGKTITLEKDVSETDRYGRLLRYVYVGDTFVNEILVKEGFAQVYTYPPDVKYSERFLAAQRQARDNNLGFWSACQNTASAKPAPSETKTPETSGGACKYSCSSPDRDCSDFSTHSEAQAFFDCCGFTAENDPMRLDSVGVGDGVTCESLP